jgi:aspartate carbamoyltransferase regulatory subunit
MNDQELHVSKIKDGTVIDHISSGYALDVVKILGITGRERKIITVAINVPSKSYTVKDIVKVEGMLLSPKEVNKIALISPHATINIIRNYVVAEKIPVKLPSVIRDIIECTNPACISKSGEPVGSEFSVKNPEPLILKCYYCGHLVEEADVLRQF